MYQPKLVVFNGKKIFQVFQGGKHFSFGLQEFQVSESKIFVMPSTSGRLAQLPKAVDKVPFFKKIKQLQHAMSTNSAIHIKDFTFPKLSFKKSRKVTNQFYSLSLVSIIHVLPGFLTDRRKQCVLKAPLLLPTFSIRGTTKLLSK